MIYFNSFFKFNRSQRTGVFLLLLLIVANQCVFFFMDFPSKELSVDTSELQVFYKEIDSLRRIEIENSKPKVFPFNPNYITDHKGYTLGMSLDEIDRLHKYRSKDKWVNSAKEFQQVTKVSDSLLAIISPYFKFPEWITNPRPKTNWTNYDSYNKPRSYEQKIDLNAATAKQLQEVNGIGEKLSERILKFRNRFVGGFISDLQLQDVYGLSPEVIERIKDRFTVKTAPPVTKFNINEASVEQLVTIQHIDYDLAYEIVDQRTLRDGFSSLDELTKVKDFPIEKIEIIKLYLTLD